MAVSINPEHAVTGIPVDLTPLEALRVALGELAHHLQVAERPDKANRSSATVHQGAIGHSRSLSSAGEVYRGELYGK